MTYERHPGVVEAMKWLEPNPNLPAKQHAIAQEFYHLAESMLSQIEKDSPQLTIGLNKLIEVRACLVRASLP